MIRSLFAGAMALALSIGAAWQAAAQDLPVLRITVFSPPSTSFLLPKVIQEAGLDVEHGFRLEVVPKPSQIAYADFGTGTDRVCFCVSITAAARFIAQGSDITLLSNFSLVSNYIITNDPDIQEVGDLEGRTLGADTATGSWATSAWLLTARGVDLDNVTILSGPSNTQVLNLTTDRVDAIVYGVGFSSVVGDSAGEYREISIFDADVWGRYSDSPAIPNASLGVWRDWIEVPENLDLAKKFYAALIEAFEVVNADPDAAADLVIRGTDLRREDIVQRLLDPTIDLRPIGEYADAVRVLTQQLLPESGQIDAPLTDEQVAALIYDFRP